MIRTLASIARCASIRSAACALLLAALLVPSLSGCALFAQALGAIPQVEPARYTHLAGQSVAVVVWAEENGVRIDYPRINLDTAQMIQARLLKSQKEDKPKELAGTKFPVSAASIARFQEEHPELSAEGVEDIATRLGVSRVIYVEIRGFHARSEVSDELFRGVASGSVTVVEVADGKGHVAFTDDTLQVSFPKTSPQEGLPNLGDFAVYHGVLEGFSTEIAKLFVPHANDRDAEYGTATPTD